jgi:hypothetical protein
MIKRIQAALPTAEAALMGAKAQSPPLEKALKAQSPPLEKAHH